MLAGKSETRHLPPEAHARSSNPRGMTSRISSALLQMHTRILDIVFPICVGPSSVRMSPSSTTPCPTRSRAQGSHEGIWFDCLIQEDCHSTFSFETPWRWEQRAQLEQQTTSAHQISPISPPPLLFLHVHPSLVASTSTSNTSPSLAPEFVIQPFFPFLFFLFAIMCWVRSLAVMEFRHDLTHPLLPHTDKYLHRVGPFVGRDLQNYLIQSWVPCRILSKFRFINAYSVIIFWGNFCPHQLQLHFQDDANITQNI